MTELDLSTFNAVVVNSSGGKDSQTALRAVIYKWTAIGGSLDRVLVSHQCLGKAEWDGTLDLARRQAEHYSVDFVVSKRRRADGVEETLLDYVRRRKKWPDNKNRYCTSDFKRGPGARVVTEFAASLRAEGIKRPRILNVFGFRAAESPARQKKPVFVINPRLTNQRKEVYDWLPIHEWSDDQVWDDIRSSGVPYHPAYDLGMPRLSCRFCIFAPRAALMISGRANPELLQEYVDVEREIGHTFTAKMSLESIQQAIQAGEQPEAMDGNWNM